MKKGSFAGLVYRELYLIMFAAFALLGWLVLLSFHYGNLGIIMTDLLASADGTLSEQAETFYENARKSLFIAMKLYPAAPGVSFCLTAADIASKDTMTAWDRFEHCTPVTPLRFASVRTTVNIMLTAASFVLPAAYMLLIGQVSGEGLSYGEFAVFVLLLIAVVAFGIIGQIFVTLLKNRDKGMLASMAFIMAGVWLVSNSLSGSGSDDDTINVLVNLAKSVLPFSPLIFIGVFAALFAAMYLIYQRREK